MNDHLLDAILDELADRVAERLAGQLGAAGAHAREGSGDGWRLLSVDELAERLGRSARWVHDACKNRGLPYRRLDAGGKAFDLDDVREWTRSRRVPADKGDS